MQSVPLLILHVQHKQVVSKVILSQCQLAFDSTTVSILTSAQYALHIKQLMARCQICQIEPDGQHQASQLMFHSMQCQTVHANLWAASVLKQPTAHRNNSLF